jgi:hypothetical protein
VTGTYDVGGSVVDGGGVVGDGDSDVPSITIGRYRVNWSYALAFPPATTNNTRTMRILVRRRVLFFIAHTPFLVDEEKGDLYIHYIIFTFGSSIRRHITKLHILGRSCA